MKKIILTGLFGLASLCVSAQEGPSDAVSFLPYRANGFLILNDAYYSNVVSWRVVIQTREFNSTTNEYDYTDVDGFQLIGKNYSKIKESYKDGLHFLTVYGLSANRDIVIVQGPLQINPNADPYKNTCEWKCVGSTYAYSLELMVNENSNGNSFVEMNSTVPASGEPYYYQWVSEAQWDVFVLGNSPNYYGLPNFSIGTYNNQYNIDKVILIDLPQGVFKLDASHTPIYGQVYGVAKNVGPWIGNEPYMHSNTLIGGETNCNQNFTWALNAVNAGDETPIPLTCDGGESWFGDENEVEDTEAEIFEPCDLQVSIESVNEFINCNTNEGEGVSVNGPFVWPSTIYSIKIRPYSEVEGDNEVVISQNLLFDDEGNYIGQPITFNKGLNHAFIVFSDGSFKRIFFETEETTTSNLTMANFLGVNAYQVPVIGNSFNLDFTATANLKFTYELKNAAGKVLFTKRYEISKDKMFTDLIEVPSGITSGLLFNKIVFQDGSEINFQTMK
jgi:hypothetical protein